MSGGHSPNLTHETKMELAISRSMIIRCLEEREPGEMVPLEKDGSEVEIPAEEALAYFRGQDWKWQVGFRTFETDADLQAFRDESLS